MQAKLSKEFLGLAGEYLVAGELCRRGVYAQLTLGHHKQTDILVETETKMLRISVKAKQGNEWPSNAGLYRTDDFLVLVDLAGKSSIDRPDFYILNLEDWINLIREEQKLHPTARVDERNRIVYADDWKGLNIRPKRVVGARERWDKIVSHVDNAELTFLGQ